MMKRKILTALLSAAIAFGLWVYVITVEKTDTTEPYYNIPVVLEGESILTERGLMIVDGRDTTVTMNIYGNRSDLRKINSGNITLVADLTRIDRAGEVELSYTYSFPGDVAQNALSVESREPGTITLSIANRITEEVPVQITYVGEQADPDKYLVDKENAVMDNRYVTISGPDMVINQIDHAEITVDLTNRKESFVERYPLTLCDEDGNGVDVSLVTANISEVSLELKILRYKDIELGYAVVNGGGATQSTSKIEVMPETIRVAGNEQVLSKLTQINLGTINLSELTKATTLHFAITLPDGVTNLSGETEATVKVSFPDLATKEFTINRILPQNVPEGLVAELAANTLKVSVRGPKEIINQMTDADLSATVDFTDKTIGTETHAVRIVINEAYADDVGAVGTYSVSATLKEAPEPTETTQP